MELTPENNKRTVGDVHVFEGKNDRDKDGRWTKENLWSKVYRELSTPPKFSSPMDLAKKGFAYFDWSDEMAGKNGKAKYTHAGMLTFMHCSKWTWYEYAKKDGYKEVCEMLMLVMEDHYEKALGWAGSFPGAFKWLQNKRDWKDESTQNQNQIVTTVTPQIIKPENTPPLSSSES